MSKDISDKEPGKSLEQPAQVSDQIGTNGTVVSTEAEMFDPIRWENYRLELISDLYDLIFARGKWAGEQPRSLNEIANDAAVRHRIQAVEALGLFPNVEAGKILRDLLRLKAGDTIAGVPGRWLRDTALLTLLSSKRLPTKIVNDALIEEYSFTKHIAPWSWGEMYDELPLLRHYGKLLLFVRAFWIWPILLCLPFVIILILQDLGLAFKPSDLPSIVNLAVVVGASLEVYFVHQWLIQWIAGQNRTVLRLPGRATSRGRLVFLTSLFTLLVLGIWLLQVTRTLGSFAVYALTGVSLLVPLLLVPIYVLSYDLSLTARYTLGIKGFRLQFANSFLRLMTIMAYITSITAFYASVLEAARKDIPALALAYLLYLLFIVPMMWKVLPELLGRLKQFLQPRRLPSESKRAA